MYVTVACTCSSHLPRPSTPAVSMAAQLTIADSLLALCPPGSAVATEAGSALSAWLQHSAKRHSWFLTAVGQQYRYAVQQISASHHHFVQFNEPTY